MFSGQSSGLWVPKQSLFPLILLVACGAHATRAEHSCKETFLHFPGQVTRSAWEILPWNRFSLKDLLMIFRCLSLPSPSTMFTILHSQYSVYTNRSLYVDWISFLQTYPSQDLAIFSSHSKSSAALLSLCVQGNVALLQLVRDKQGFLELICTNSALVVKFPLLTHSGPSGNTKHQLWRKFCCHCSSCGCYYYYLCLTAVARHGCESKEGKVRKKKKAFTNTIPEKVLAQTSFAWCGAICPISRRGTIQKEESRANDQWDEPDSHEFLIFFLFLLWLYLHPGSLFFSPLNFFC